MGESMSPPFDLVLGRKTYEILHGSAKLIQTLPEHGYGSFAQDA